MPPTGLLERFPKVAAPTMITTRSHHQAWFTCRRLRYLRYHEGGLGVVSPKLDLALTLGGFGHAILAKCLKLSLPYEHRSGYQPIGAFQASALLEEQFLSEASQGGLAQEARGIVSLATALAHAWLTYQLPVLLGAYEVVAVEEEWKLQPHPDIEWPYRIDLVLRDRATREIVPLDFKFVSYVDNLEAYRYDMQTLSHTLACEMHYQEPCSKVLLHFLHKGVRRKEQWYSPLVRGFQKTGVPPFDETTYQWEYRHGWQYFDAWTYPGGLQAWLDFLPDDVKRQTIITKEVFRHSDVDSWLKQFVAQELFIAEGLEHPNKRELYFPGNLDSTCFKDKYNRRCAYTRFCFEGLTLEEALASGEFVWRTPHYGEP